MLPGGEHLPEHMLANFAIFLSLSQSRPLVTTLGCSSDTFSELKNILNNKSINSRFN